MPGDAFKMIELNYLTFKNEVIDSKVPAAVLFYISNGKTDKILMNVFEKLSIDYGKRFKFAVLNIGTYESLAEQYRIKNTPVIVFFSKGKEIERNIGNLPENILRMKIDDILEKKYSSMVEKF